MPDESALIGHIAGAPLSTGAAVSSPPARDRWSRLVDDLESSGLPVAAFAHQRGVRPSTLAWWRSHFRRRARDRGPEFAELLLRDEPRCAEGHLRLELHRWPATLQIDSNADLRLLRAVLEALC